MKRTQSEIQEILELADVTAFNMLQRGAILDYQPPTYDHDKDCVDVYLKPVTSVESININLIIGS